ncbi:TetR/AcrR family transcriptional regulator [Agrobacterium deltaense]|uniref:TetR/AcrR family transcriptional regulator n=1 Tax=Agrobacterium deltaense TaxID=1183412 RepID=UPI003FD1C69E
MTETGSRDAASTRARILSSARTEFAEHGLDGARVDSIAAIAKVNKRMIYQYFGNKNSLFERVMKDARCD